MRVASLSDAFLRQFDVPLMGNVAVWAAAMVLALALCRAAAASGDRTSPPSASAARRTRSPGSPPARNSLVGALGVALFAMLATPAGATVHRPSKRGITPRDISGSCPGADLRPTGTNVGRIRAATLCLVNRERAGQGERHLVFDMRLQQAAQTHTDSMAFGNYFEHDGPRGDTPLSRMRAAGYMYSSQKNPFEVGENIGWGALWEGTPRAVVAAWMVSPGHRANILDAHFRDTGIGVSPHPPTSLARGQVGAIYTQDFGS